MFFGFDKDFLSNNIVGIGERWLYQYVNYSINVLNLNQVISASGPPGSGKSWSGIRTGYKIDKNFTMDNVIFPGIDYIKIFADPKLKSGSFIVWDDAGLGAPAREFWSQLNRAVGAVAQSSRFRKLILWITLPDISFIDSQVRKLRDIHLEFIKRKDENQPISAWIYLVQTNLKTGKIYYKHPRYYDPDIGPIAIGVIQFRQPPPTYLTDIYEERKHEYMMNFYQGLVDDFETGGIVMDDYRAKLLILLINKNKKLGLSQKNLAEEIGIKEQSLSRAKAKAEKMLRIT